VVRKHPPSHSQFIDLADFMLISKEGAFFLGEFLSLTTDLNVLIVFLNTPPHGPWLVVERGSMHYIACACRRGIAGSRFWLSLNFSCLGGEVGVTSILQFPFARNP